MGKVHEKVLSESSSESLHLVVAAEARVPDTGASCCVEAECHFYYLRESSLYVHESCLLGYQRHPLTYVGHRWFCYGPLTKYGKPISVTHLADTVSSSCRDFPAGAAQLLSQFHCFLLWNFSLLLLVDFWYQRA